MTTSRTPRSNGNVAPLDQFTENDAARELQRVDPAEEKSPDELFADRLRGALHGGGEGIKVKLYRMTATGERAFLCNYSPEQFDAGDYEMIRDQWGGGRFEVRVIGKTGIITKGEFLIEEMRQPNPVAQTSNNNSELAQVLRAMQEQNATIAQALAQRPDPMMQMGVMFDFMAKAREAMGLNAAPPAPAAAVSPTAMLGELMGALKTLKEVAAEAAPPAPSDDPMTMFATMGPQVLDLIKTGMAQRQQAPALAYTPAPAPAQPAAGVTLPASMQTAEPVGAAVPEPQTENGNDVNAVQILMLRGLLQQFVGLAAAGKPFAEGGEFILEKAPDEVIDALQLPNWWDILMALEPAVKPHQAWITQAREYVIVELSKPEDPNAPA